MVRAWCRSDGTTRKNVEKRARSDSSRDVAEYDTCRKRFIKDKMLTICESQTRVDTQHNYNANGLWGSKGEAHVYQWTL